MALQVIAEFTNRHQHCRVVILDLSRSGDFIHSVNNHHKARGGLTNLFDVFSALHVANLVFAADLQQLTIGPAGCFIGYGGAAYRFLAGHEIQYPSFDVGCLGADPIQSIALARKISQALPETVFLYMSPTRRPEGGRTAPMVLDHGKALMLIEPAAKDSADGRAAPRNGSNGAVGQEQSHPPQGAAS
ncbi:hypothetical protein D7243_20630 [Stutzerimonas stutzeri]|nr:hypothetical protein [Stutzerimonas stutzeri]